MNILYVDKKVVTWVIKCTNIVYDEGMRVSWGKKQDYLGMDLNLSVPGEVRVTMVDYLKKVITNLPEEIMETPPTPTGRHMFELYPDEERNLLDK